ncbi:MAG TPA: hypothetical protein VF463_11725 [Sphingobium sp.]
MAFDQLGTFAEVAAARGMGLQIEFVPGLDIGDLSTVLAAVNHVDRADFGLVVDAMHLFRSGATAADVAALDPAARRISSYATCRGRLRRRAMAMRPVSSGAVPVPVNCSCRRWWMPCRATGSSRWISMKTRTLAGESFEDQFAPCIAATRAMRAQARAQSAAMAQ